MSLNNLMKYGCVFINPFENKKKKMSVCMAGVGEGGDPSREYRAYI